MECVRHELKHILKQGYKDKIVGIREEILRKRRAGKLPGDTTSVLKAWWQSHSKWPYPMPAEEGSEGSSARRRCSLWKKVPKVLLGEGDVAVEEGSAGSSARRTCSLRKKVLPREDAGIRERQRSSAGTHGRTFSPFFRRIPRKKVLLAEEPSSSTSSTTHVTQSSIL
ncbi:Homeobox protein knotted-1-like 3 [Glycine max]|nr:Homeobox protein knotted-1-like 3 [Glycine max]